MLQEIEITDRSKRTAKVTLFMMSGEQPDLSRGMVLALRATTNVDWEHQMGLRVFHDGVSCDPSIPEAEALAADFRREPWVGMKQAKCFKPIGIAELRDKELNARVDVLGTGRVSANCAT